MRPLALTQFKRHSKRFEAIVKVLAKYGLADWIRDWNPDFVKRLFRDAEGHPISEMATEVRIRLALSELGTTFIKLGQMLSTRADLIGPELAAELSKLQVDTPADTPEVVRATLEAELGMPADELYAEFDDRPMASASIGQVHEARLHNGESVVVKIQHRGIEDKITNDLEILGALVELAERHSKELQLYQPRAAVDEFRRNLMRELDFNRERRNLEEFARNFEHDSSVRFPKAYAALSSRRVLTMERLDGARLSDHDRLFDEGIETSGITRRGAAVYLDMIFRDGFYHADPHPGNILILPGGVVGLLDCGMVGRIDEQTREDFEEIMLAAVEQEYMRLTDTLLRIGATPPGLDREAFQSEIAEFVADYGGQSLEGFDLGSCMNDGVAIIRRFRVVLRPAVSLLGKTLVMLEGTSRELDREFSLAQLLQPYYLKAVGRRLSPMKLLRRVQRTYRDWERLLEMLPRGLTDMLFRVQKGTFDVNLEHRRLDATINRLVYGILSAALFLGSAMLWSRAAPPLIGGVSVFGAAGFAVAVILGAQLLLSIRRSGGLGRRRK